MCLVLGGECALRHDAEGVGRANLDDALRRLLAEHDILRLDPPHGRGELVCEQLDEQRVRELLLDLGTHGGGQAASAAGVRDGVTECTHTQWVSRRTRRKKRRVSTEQKRQRRGRRPAGVLLRCGEGARRWQDRTNRTALLAMARRLVGELAVGGFGIFRKGSDPRH